MKLSVFGQRSIEDSERIIAVLDANVDLGHDITYLHGGAKGPQQIVFDYFQDKGTADCVIFRPWTMISKRLANQAMEGGSFDPTYFFFRNIQIVDNSDLVIFFDNGEQDAEVYKVRDLCIKKEIMHLTIEMR